MVRFSYGRKFSSHHVDRFADMKCRRIIFLDFDGVLATDSYDDVLLAGGERLRDCFGRRFDPSCVASLRDVIESTGADIVITSSWRLYLNPLAMRLMWKFRRMPGAVKGYTPRILENRGMEISKWLSRHQDVASYVILDDMDKRQFYMDQHVHLVTCDHFGGMSSDDARRAIQILREE